MKYRGLKVGSYDPTSVSLTVGVRYFFNWFLSGQGTGAGEMVMLGENLSGDPEMSNVICMPMHVIMIL
jgi:hypothetical protein